MEENNVLQERLLSYLAINKLVKPTVVVGIITIVIIVFFLGLISWAALKKFDDNTEYTVSSESDVITYIPNSPSSPGILLNNFKPLYDSDCARLSVTKFYSGELKLKGMVEIRLTAKSSNKLLLQFKSLPGNGEDTKILELLTDEGRCDINNKYALEIILNEKEPQFVLKVVGNIEAGTKIGYSTGTYPELLKSGEIIIIDRSFLTRLPIQLSSIKLNKGDQLILSSDENAITTGLVTAQLGAYGLSGIFHKKGGTVDIAKPYSDPVPINEGFIERITNDNELALGLTISFVILQIFAYILTTLIRLSILSSNVPAIKHRRFIDRNRKA